MLLAVSSCCLPCHHAAYCVICWLLCQHARYRVIMLCYRVSMLCYRVSMLCYRVIIQASSASSKSSSSRSTICIMRTFPGACASSLSTSSFSGAKLTELLDTSSDSLSASSFGGAEPTELLGTSSASLWEDSSSSSSASCQRGKNNKTSWPSVHFQLARAMHAQTSSSMTSSAQGVHYIGGRYGREAGVRGEQGASAQIPLGLPANCMAGCCCTQDKWQHGDILLRLAWVTPCHALCWTGKRTMHM